MCAPPPNAFRRADCDRVIECRVRDAFGIELVENATTGFRWELTVHGGVTVVDEQVRAPDPMTPGAAGVRVWTLRPERPGSTSLEFVSRQPWEPEGPPADWVHFDVVVTGDRSG